MNDRPWRDEEFPEPDPEDDDFGEAPSIECPNCGAEIFSELCPYCDEFVTDTNTSVLAGKPWWFVMLALLGIVTFILGSIFVTCY